MTSVAATSAALVRTASGVGIRDERCFCLRRLFLVAAAVGDADQINGNGAWP